MFLSEKPAIGIVGGTGAGLLNAVYDAVANESVIRFVSAIGVYAGVCVAVLTIIAKVIEIRRNFRKI